MDYNDLTYWIAVAHLKGWNVERINRMTVAVLHENEMKWADFFELDSAGWDVGLAMARNAYIYGLAKEICVAESDDKGGTWNGALGGLKMKRKVYVRMPEPIDFCSEVEAEAIAGRIASSFTYNALNCKEAIEICVYEMQLNL